MSKNTGERERDEKNGRFEDKYPPAEVTTAIESLGGRAATSEVAEEVGCARDTAYAKLKILSERGEVESEKAGGIRVWEVTDDE